MHLLLDLGRLKLLEGLRLLLHQLLRRIQDRQPKHVRLVRSVRCNEGLKEGVNLAKIHLLGNHVSVLGEELLVLSDVVLLLIHEVV